MQQVLEGLNLIMAVQPFALLIGGVFLGIVFGSMPGLTATLGIVILMPLTFTLPPVPGLAMLLGMYVGAVYGGSIPAILLNIPGTPASIATSLDGNKLARQGEAGRALGIATISSYVGGTISALLLIMIAPLMALAVLRFGPPEYFAVGIFGLSIIAGVSSGSLYKGLLAGAVGILISTIGIDPISGMPRFTYGVADLFSGLSFVPVMVGLFGFREVLLYFETTRVIEAPKHAISKIIPSRSDLSRITGTVLRGSLIGTFVGSLPGAGGPIAAFLSYDTARQSSRRKEEFGTGLPEGVAAAESANNAVTGGALVPLLTLGIPGDGVTAILLGALMMHNLRPGPALFQQNGEVVSAIYIALIIANIAMLVFGLVGARLFARVTLVPQHVMIPFIAVFCVVGTYAVQNSFFDVFVMIGFGIVGVAMNRAGFSVIPLVLGLILGPIIEVNMRQSLIISGGSWAIFATRPLSLAILVLAAIGAVWPYIAARFFGEKPSAEA